MQLPRKVTVRIISSAGSGSSCTCHQTTTGRGLLLLRGMGRSAVISLAHWLEHVKILLLLILQTLLNALGLEHA